MAFYYIHILYYYIERGEAQYIFFRKFISNKAQQAQHSFPSLLTSSKNFPLSPSLVDSIALSFTKVNYIIVI